MAIPPDWIGQNGLFTTYALDSVLTIDNEFRRTYTSRYRVIAASVQSGPKGVVNAPGIPAFRSTYVWPPPPFTAQDTDAWAFCTNAESRQESPLGSGGSRQNWIVTVTHETLRRQNTGERRPVITEVQDPTDEPAIWSGTHFTKEVEVRRDINNKIIATSANERIDPPPTMEEYQDTIIVEINTSEISLGLRRLFLNKVNEFTFWGFQPRELKLSAWDWDVRYYGPSNTPYVVNRFEFQTDTVNQWKLRVLNYGTYYKETAGSTEPKISLDADGLTPIPFYLNADGTIQSWPPPATPTYTDYDYLGDEDFLQLPVPSTLPAGVIN